MDRFKLKQKEERRLLRGHLWVYRNELEEEQVLADGAVVDVMSATNRFIGRGFYQAEGGIAVRLLSRHQDEMNADFFDQRITEAYEFRQRIFPGQSTYRWIHGESDGLPGFVADRYGAVVSVNSPCAFYAEHGGIIADCFLSKDGVEGVRLTVRGKVQVYGQVADPVEYELDGLRLALDAETGQKTGTFLDQRVNSLALVPYAKGARVLDGHCYHGLWSCHAAQAGASSVTGVDTSASALECAKRNAAMNGVADICSFECRDIADALAEKSEYDVVLIDPPALAKSRRSAKKALGLYQALNKDAMKRVAKGGMLVTSSCSHFIDMPAFMEMLKRAATAARRQVCLVDSRGASPDHPVLMSMPETAYLTCAFLRVF